MIKMKTNKEMALVFMLMGIVLVIWSYIIISYFPWSIIPAMIGGALVGLGWSLS